MTIAVASDHAGFDVKSKLIRHLTDRGHEVLDLGPDSADSVDYPEYAHRVGKTVVNQDAERGIVICGTGIGVSIAANKVPGVRAALCTTVEHARLSREHNNANVLALGARLTDYHTIQEITDCWLATSFAGGRHERRVNKIEL